MDIQFTEEQELLRSSVQRLLRDRYDFDARRKIVATDEGWSRRTGRPSPNSACARRRSGKRRRAWRRTAGDDDRDAGIRPQPRCRAVLRDRGSRGRPDREIGSPAQREAFLPEIMAGDAIWALAWAEGRSRYDFNNVAATARREGENYVLSGTKAAVIGAPWADSLIVSARTSGGPRDRSGVSLFVVDRLSPNLHLQSFKTIDGRRAAELTLMDVQAYVYATELNPSRAVSHQLAGMAKIALGSAEEAFEPLQEAIRLSPHDLHSADLVFCTGWAYWELERYPEALHSLERAKAQNSRLTWANAHLASTYIRLDQQQKAEAAIRDALQYQSNWTTKVVEKFLSVTTREFSCPR